MRVYIPATWPMLRRLVSDGRFDPIGGTAFAVTPKLREVVTADDEEELEYAAMSEAARAALRLLSVEFGLGEDATPARRAVVVADVAGAALRPDLDDAAVRLPGPVPTAAIVSVHVDTEEAEHAVRQAAGAVDAADLGDLDADFLVGEAEDHELAWYDPTEVAFLVGFP